MQITDKNLDKLRQWLIDRGRSEDTAALYVVNIRSCAAVPQGLTYRLVSGDLAPNTVRTNLASLRAWATFSKDAELLLRLDDLRLPPARRVKHKPPLGLETWRKVVRHLRSCKIRPEPMRNVLLIMALRGMRSGDVLRMRRTEVARALETGKLAYEGKGRKRIEFDIAPIRDQLVALSQVKGWDRVRDLLGTGTRKSISRKVWRAAIRTAKAAGVHEMNPHRYRHTFATAFLGELRGDPNAIVKLQKYMAWESMNTAARYVDSVSITELDKIGADLIGNLLRE